MRKLGRMVRRVLTAVSLLLFVAVLAAWVRGYWMVDVFYRDRGWEEEPGTRARSWGIKWGRGEIGLHSWFVRNDWRPSARKRRQKTYSPEIRWDYGLNHGASESLLAEFARFEPANRDWAWHHLGILLATDSGEESPNGSRGPMSTTYWIKRIVFPCWMAALVFGALPSWRFIAWRRGRRRILLAAREGRCRVCGYDLRASPQRCPECGLAVEVKE